MLSYFSSASSIMRSLVAKGFFLRSTTHQLEPTRVRESGSRRLH
eukprot:SAG25_NODE_14688_length_252_cov_0.666667_1_plen_43_part_01